MALDGSVLEGNIIRVGDVFSSGKRKGEKMQKLLK
jgi:hypothetical protein